MRGGPLDPLASHADPDATIKTALGGGVEAGGLEHVALTSTDPDELTLRAARLLAGADRVYHLPDVPPAILDRARRCGADRCVRPAPGRAAGTVRVYRMEPGVNREWAYVG